jgi:YjbE family integral membrane protein
MELELFSAAFFSALFAIILIDLVLAGDNALVIGLVARNLPKHLQNRVIFWGTFGAIAIRVVMALMVVWILKVPGFMLVGGIALVWIAYKLLSPQSEEAAAHVTAAPAASLGGAIRTIVVADAVMGIDNVLAIGGAAQGSVLLIVLGLAISVPIVVWGSRLVITLVDRYPSVILLGGAVLAWTAYSMIVREPLAAPWFAEHASAKLMVAVLVFSIALAPWFAARLARQMQPVIVLMPAMLLWMLAFEVAATVWQVRVDYLLATGTGEYLLEGARWLGWVPLAAAGLWLRERFASRHRRQATLEPR